MKATHLLRLSALLLISGSLFLGCGKKNPHSDGNPDAARDLGVSAPTVFKPEQVVSTADVQMPADFLAAYEQTAQLCKSFSTVPPYDRETILENAIPAFKRLATLEQHLSKLQSDQASEMIKIDPRFASVGQLKDVKAFFHTPAPSTRSTASLSEDPGGLSKPQDPGVISGPAAVVSRGGPQAAMELAGKFGSELQHEARQAHLAGNLQHTVEKLLTVITTKGTNWESSVTIVTHDNLDERAAKVGLRIVYGDLLSKIVAYKNSYFLAANRPDGSAEVWEFKQPVSLVVSRQEPDEKTKLNSGLELTAQIQLNVAGEDGLFRSYKNGYWNSWKAAPNFGTVQIEKTEQWNASWAPNFGFDSFSRLSPAEIDLVLLASETTRTVAKAEAALNDTAQNDSRNEANLALLQNASAHCDVDQALNYSKALLLTDEQLPADLAKKTASALLDVLHSTNETLVDGYYRGSLFDFYLKYGKTSELGEMSPQPFPMRNTEKHPYGIICQELVNQLVLAMQQIAKAEPSNRDAQFDLAFWSMISETPDTEAASWALKKAIAQTGPKPPLSGRNFRRIVVETPTFFLLARISAEQNAQTNIRTVAARLGANDPELNNYRSRFGKAFEYYAYGY